jgi:hypothetical protein
MLLFFYVLQEYRKEVVNFSKIYYYTKFKNPTVVR